MTGLPGVCGVHDGVSGVPLLVEGEIAEYGGWMALNVRVRLEPTCMPWPKIISGRAVVFILGVTVGGMGFRVKHVHRRRQELHLEMGRTETQNVDQVVLWEENVLVRKIK
jgi:hypothetical protein